MRAGAARSRSCSASSANAPAARPDRPRRASRPSAATRRARARCLRKDARRRAGRYVACALGVRVGERGIAAVIFGRAVRVEHLQLARACREPPVQVLVGRRLDVVHHVRPVFRVLTEPLVELAPETAGDVRDDPVERFAALLVEVEIVVDQSPEESSGLRAAVGVHGAESVGRRVALARGPALEPGGAVAQRGDPEPDHRRADRGIGDLVQAALLEAALEPDVARIRDDRAGRAREAHRPRSIRSHLVG